MNIFLQKGLYFLELNINSDRKLVSMIKYYMTFIKINRCSWTFIYSNENRKENFFNRIMYVLSRKNGSAKES